MSIVIAGPSIGNLNKQIRINIPHSNDTAEKDTLRNLCLNTLNVSPSVTPSSPVVKGKTNSSPGCISRSNKIAKKYDRKPCFIEITIEMKMGNAANGLIP
ncbi:hypothetical protein ACFVHQ_08765 [Actinomycetes bacterium NPDC127524]